MWLYMHTVLAASKTLQAARAGTRFTSFISDFLDRDRLDLLWRAETKNIERRFNSDGVSKKFENAVNCCNRSIIFPFFVYPDIWNFIPLLDSLSAAVAASKQTLRLSSS